MILVMRGASLGFNNNNCQLSREKNHGKFRLVHDPGRDNKLSDSLSRRDEEDSEAMDLDVDGRIKGGKELQEEETGEPRTQRFVVGVVTQEQHANCMEKDSDNSTTFFSHGRTTLVTDGHATSSRGYFYAHTPSNFQQSHSDEEHVEDDALVVGVNVVRWDSDPESRFEQDTPQAQDKHTNIQ